jgi:RNA polymerase sigma factor (sigma-70 family)
MADRRDDPDIDEAPDDERLHDAALVERVRAGDDSAFAEIYDKWFDRVHDLARRIVRDPETAAEVAQDTFLAAWQKLDALDQPASLGGWLLRIARNRALNRSDREKRSSAVGDDTMAAIEAGGGQVSAPAGFRIEERVARADDPAIAAEDNEAAALLWSAVVALGERDQTVLTMHLRYGMTPAEIGEALGVNRNAANQMVHRVKGRLDSAVQARVLWDGDRPRCDRLVADLAAASVESFGPDAVKVAERHVESCAECGERRRLRLQPAALFGALPVLIAPQILKQKVAAALAADGVPVDPAAYGSGSGHAAVRDGSHSSDGDGSSTEGPGTAEGPASFGAADDGVGPGASRRRGLAVAAVAVLVIAALVGVVLVTDGDDGQSDQVVAGSAGPDGDGLEALLESSTGSDDETTTSSSESVAPESLAPDSLPSGDEPSSDAPPLVSPQPQSQPQPQPVPQPQSPQPPGPPVDPLNSFTLSPSTKSDSFYLYADAPVLSWSVKPGYTVRVSGPGLPVQSALSGSVAVCPTQNAPWAGSCIPGFGPFNYVLSIRSGNTVVASHTRTLTVTLP